MAIDATKFDQARDAIRAMQETIGKMNEILIITDRAILQNKQGNPIVSLTANQKTQLLAEYDKAKTELQNAIIQIP
mgnify:CR=1 FL=1